MLLIYGNNHIVYTVIIITIVRGAVAVLNCRIFYFRYIRAQKSNEKVADNMPKNLKKNNRDLWWELSLFFILYLVENMNSKYPNCHWYISAALYNYSCNIFYPQYIKCLSLVNAYLHITHFKWIFKVLYSILRARNIHPFHGDILLTLNLITGCIWRWYYCGRKFISFF